jgi:peroxiredoxin
MFKFRFVLRFKNFKEHLINMNIVKSDNSKYHKLFAEKEKLTTFTLSDFNEEYISKIEKLYDVYKLSIGIETCFHCLRKGIIVCERCKKFYYCSKEHKNEEWRIYHFFECYIVQFILEMKQYKGDHYASKRRCLTFRILF